MVTTALVFFVAASLQFVMWGHGTQVVQAAARDGARVGRLGGTGEESRAVALGVVEGASGGWIRGAGVDARITGTARVEVWGDVPSLVPFLTVSVRGVVEAPVERFRPDGAGS